MRDQSNNRIPGRPRLALILAACVACLVGGAAKATDDFTQPLRVSPDGRFLMQPDGAPFFWLADTGWALFQRLNREDAEQYLADRASKGYTLIQAAVIAPADPFPTPNRYGELPFIDLDPARPNPKYFEHVDWIVERAARYGLRIGLLPLWADISVGGWVHYPQPKYVPRIFTPEKAEAYGRWLGHRYKNKGLVWILGGDANPLGVTSFYWKDGQVDRAKSDFTILDYRPVYDAMARGITTGAGGKPIISYHLTCCSWSGTAPPRTSLYLGDRPWLTLNMLQSSHFRDPEVVKRLAGASFAWDGARNYEAVSAEYDSMPTRPVIDGEPRYEDLAVDVESDPKIIAVKGYFKAYDVRNAAYHAVFAGAAGHTYGNHSIWQFFDPAHSKPVQDARADMSWQQAMQQPGGGQMQYVKALMLSRPYFTRIPDQSLIVGEAGEGESHIGATRDRTGSYAMVFLPKGQTVTVDLNKLSGSSAVAWWFDPRTGGVARIEGSFPTNARTTFAPPSSGPENDWVLVIDDASKGFGAPGAAAAATPLAGVWVPNVRRIDHSGDFEDPQ